MSNSISVGGAVPYGESGYGGNGHSQPDPGAGQAGPAKSEPGESPDPADLRLVIEDDAAGGSPIYRIVDRRTGKVVQELPREQILALREAPDYTAGAVIKAKV